MQLMEPTNSYINQNDVIRKLLREIEYLKKENRKLEEQNNILIETVKKSGEEAEATQGVQDAQISTDKPVTTVKGDTEKELKGDDYVVPPPPELPSLNALPQKKGPLKQTEKASFLAPKNEKPLSNLLDEIKNAKLSHVDVRQTEPKKGANASKISEGEINEVLKKLNKVGYEHKQKVNHPSPPSQNPLFKIIGEALDKRRDVIEGKDEDEDEENNEFTDSRFGYRSHSEARVRSTYNRAKIMRSRTFDHYLTPNKILRYKKAMYHVMI